MFLCLTTVRRTTCQPWGLPLTSRSDSCRRNARLGFGVITKRDGVGVGWGVKSCVSEVDIVGWFAYGFWVSILVSSMKCVGVCACL